MYSNKEIQELEFSFILEDLFEHFWNHWDLVTWRKNGMSFRGCSTCKCCIDQLSEHWRGLKIFTKRSDAKLINLLDC